MYFKHSIHRYFLIGIKFRFVCLVFNICSTMAHWIGISDLGSPGNWRPKSWWSWEIFVSKRQYVLVI